MPAYLRPRTSCQLSMEPGALVLAFLRTGERIMSRFIGLTALAALVLLAGPLPVGAADELDWAYPVTPRPEPLDNLILKQVPGSTKAYTQAQIDDPFNPPDWFPDEHPPMPAVVAQGQKPAVR